MSRFRPIADRRQHKYHRRLMRVCLTAVLSLLASASAAAAPPLPAIAKGPSLQTVRFGQRADYGSASVRPLRLLGDSRCPADVECVWAGTVKILVEVVAHRKLHRRTIALDEAIRLDRGVWVTLALVCPVARAGEKIPPSSYRLTFLHGTNPQPRALDAVCPQMSSFHP